MSLENYLLGKRAESLFDAKCAERGLVSIRPESDKTACDRWVKREDGKMVVVQIKASGVLARLKKGIGRGQRWCYKVDNRRANKEETVFSRAGVDVMAVYVEPLDRWHLFPAGSYGGKRIYIAKSPVGQMKKWIENWDLLRAGAGCVFLKPKQVQLTLSIL